MNKEYLRALRTELVGRKMSVELNLQNLLSNTVGIGEHVHIDDDVAKLVSTIDNLGSRIDTINELCKRWGLDV